MAGGTGTTIAALSATEDASFVAQLAADLARAGYALDDISTTVAREDASAEPGILRRHLADAAAALVVLTPAAAASDQVRVEIEFAHLAGLEERIVPLILTPTEVPHSLRAVSPILFTAGAYDAALTRLIARLTSLGAQPGDAKATETSTLYALAPTAPEAAEPVAIQAGNGASPTAAPPTAAPEAEAPLAPETYLPPVPASTLAAPATSSQPAEASIAPEPEVAASSNAGLRAEATFADEPPPMGGFPAPITNKWAAVRPTPTPKPSAEKVETVAAPVSEPSTWPAAEATSTADASQPTTICQTCGATVHFEQVRCRSCGMPVAIAITTGTPPISPAIDPIAESAPAEPLPPSVTIPDIEPVASPIHTSETAPTTPDTNARWREAEAAWSRATEVASTAAAKLRAVLNGTGSKATQNYYVEAMDAIQQAKALIAQGDMAASEAAPESAARQVAERAVSDLIGLSQYFTAVESDEAPGIPLATLESTSTYGDTMEAQPAMPEPPAPPIAVAPPPQRAPISGSLSAVPAAPPPPSAPPEVALPLPMTPSYSVPPVPTAAPGSAAMPAAEAASQAKSAQQSEEVAFTAYYPREVMPQAWERLLVYISLAAGSVLAGVEADATERLAGRRDAFRSASGPETTWLPRGTVLTLVPSLPGYTFNPPMLSVRWEEEVQAHEFRMRAEKAMPGLATNGSVAVFTGPLLRGEVPISVFTRSAPGQGAGPTDYASHVARAYRRIFASYAHRDNEVVAACERTAEALGDRYLRDVRLLRSGEQWDERLLQAITEADIFQLFWSKSAALSPAVEREWRHALVLQARREGYIRPVFWTDQPYTIPSELASIHFAHMPREALGLPAAHRGLFGLFRR